MTTWHDIASENEAAAKDLLRGRRWRSCVSRAYFAAYASTTDRLRAQGVHFGGPRVNPSHGALPEMIEGNIAALKPWERRDLKAVTRRLYAARCAADYADTAPIGEVEARQSLTDLTLVRRLLSPEVRP